MTQITYPAHYTRIVLTEYPKTCVIPTTFRKETVPFDLKPGPSEILVQVDWLSIDPGLRTWLGGAYRHLPPPQIGMVTQSHPRAQHRDRSGRGGLRTTPWGCRERPTGQVYSTVFLFRCLYLRLDWAEYAVMKEAEIIQKFQ